MAYLDYPGLQRYHGKVQGEINELKDDLDKVGISENVKTTLLACFEHVAWTDEHGQDYYDALETALYESGYPRIKAIYNGSGHVVYTDDDLGTIKPYLTVTYYETRDSEGQVISASNYTLSGLLTEGDNNIRVTYGDYSAFVNIYAIDFYNISLFDTSNLLVTNNQLAGNYNSTMGFNAPSNTRRGLFTRHGHKGILEYQTLEPTDFYPIPVPKDATKCTITINEAGMYFAVKKWHYYPDTNMYSTSYFDSGWQTSPLVIDLTPAENEFLTINIKNGSAGTDAFTSEPTGSFVFE